MQRNTVTSIVSLIPGDRFYKLKDGKKTVLEWGKLHHDGKTVIAWTINDKNEKQKPVTIQLTEEVVFLRNNQS